MDKRSMIAQMSARTGRPEMDYEGWSIGALASGLKTTPATNLGNITNVNPDDIRHMVEDAISKLDVADLLDKLIDERVNGLTTPTLVDIQIDETTSKVEQVHQIYPKVKALASLKRNGRRRDQYWHGAPGAGKTHTAYLMAADIGIPFASINLLPQSPKSDLFGYMDAMGKYHGTAFTRLFEHGGVYLADEFDNCSAAIAVSLHPALANGWLELPSGDRINRHEDFHFIAAANTTGRGGTINHSGRQALDGATIDRFVFIEWGYDESLEAAIVKSINPAAGWWLNWVRDVRAYAADNHPALIASPRVAADGAEMLLLGDAFTRHEIAEACLFKGISRDIARNVLSNVPLPMGAAS